MTCALTSGWGVNGCMSFGEFIFWFIVTGIFVRICVGFIARDVVKKQKERKARGDHIQARRARSHLLEKYIGSENEIVLDMDEMKIRKFDGKTEGGKFLTGKNLYNSYKNSRKLFFDRGQTAYLVSDLPGGLSFFKMTEEENKDYIGKEGEIVEVTDTKRLVVHDGKLAGGFAL